MTEKVKSFEKETRENGEFQRKLAAELKRIAENKEAENDAEAIAKAAQALGYDFTAADMEKANAETQELDPEEMKSASGGCCLVDYGCFTVYKHDGTGKNAACMKEYTCMTVYHDSKIEELYKNGQIEDTETVVDGVDNSKDLLETLFD